MKRLVLAVLLSFCLDGCDHISGYSVNELSVPTPLGPLVIKLDQKRKVESLSAERLGKLPLGVKDGKLEPGEYHSTSDLKFAVWIPDDCTHEAGRFLALDPGFNTDVQREYEKILKEQLRDYEQLPPRIKVSDLYLQSESVRYKCGPAFRVKFINGSVIGGWKINEKRLSEMRTIGTATVEYPSREIQVTAVPKAKLVQAGYTPSTANLLLWANEFSLVTDHEKIFVGKDTNQLYSLSRTAFENVEILDKPRTIRFQVLTGMFDGTLYLYFVHVIALVGPTTEGQWQTLQASLESFRYE